MRTLADVHEHLAERDVAHEIVHLSQPSTTAALAAGALGVPLGVIVKSLVFVLDGHPALVLVSGDRTVDADRLRAVGGCRWLHPGRLWRSPASKSARCRRADSPRSFW